MTKVLLFPVAQNIVRLPIDLIQENVVNLRTIYAEEPLDELKESVGAEGLLQPIMVAPNEDGTYELIYGSRRLRAEKSRESSEITAIISEPKSSLNYILMALAENIHREMLDPFEEARVFLRLTKEYGLGAVEIGKLIKKDNAYVTRRLQLISLPDEVQSMVAERKLSIEHASVLSMLPTGDDQSYWAERASEEKFTFAELRKMVQTEGGQPRRARATSGTITAGKFRARLELFVEWFGRAVERLPIKRLNSDERAALIRILGKLEMTLRSLRNTLEKNHADSKSASYGNAGAPRNASEVWPAGHVKKIMAEDRPSDEVLARELGRTVGAIRAMRSHVASTKKRRRA